MSVYAPGTSQHYGGGSKFGPSSELLRMQQQNINMEILTAANPWLAEDPQTLLHLSTSGMDPEELANNAAAMAGMDGLDRMAANLANLDPIAQRSVYAQLTPQQQRGLQSIGFQPNQADMFDGNFITGNPLSKAVIGGVTTGVSTAMKPLASTVAPVFSVAFDSLAWLSDVPAHFYRAIRQMEGWQQLLALGVGVAAGVAAAPFVAAGTAGMGTLALVGGIGGAALAGGVAATAPTAVTNRTEWWDMMNPWGSTGVRRGERIFSKSSQEKAFNTLGGAEHIDAMARDIAANMDAYDFAQDFAGVAEAGNVNVMTQSIERVAKGLAGEPGSEEYARVYKGLSDLVEMPEFRTAIETLQDGKMSFGRDVAQAFQLDPGDRGYGFVSGSMDAAWLIAMDPTMAVGKIGRLARMSRRGMAYDFSPEATARLANIINENKGVGAAVDQLAKGMNDNNFELIPKAWRGMHGGIQEWMLARGQTTFTRADFLEYIDDGHNFGAIMSGKGNVKGLEQIVLDKTNRSEGWGRFMHSVRRFQEGMTDEVYEATLRREAKKQGDDVARQLDHDFPGDYHEQAMDLTWQPVKAHPDSVHALDAYSNGAAAGKVMALVPGGRSLGRFIGNISTMTPANRMIMMTGDQSVEDIPRFVETMGRHFSMNSATRKAWLNEIMSKGTVAQRRQVTYSFMNNLFEVGGMNSTAAGRELSARYMTKYKQAFAQGGNDLFEAGGLARNIGWLPDVHQADALLVPNLREMSKISRHGIMVKQVARLTDSELLEGMMSRYIKPGWLLRIGFIPRNAGEEMLAFTVRMTEGGIAKEFAARNVGTRNVYKEIEAKFIEAGRDFGKLTDDEIRVLTRDPVPTFMKPLAAIGRSTGWRPLQEKHLQGYADWLAANLTDGFTNWTPSKDMPQWQRTLLMGRQNSVRSLFFEGLDPTWIKAGELWNLRHSDAIMKSVSSLNASVFERARMNPNTALMKLPDEETGAIEDVVVVLTGERGKVGFSDMRYAAAMHTQSTEWLQDERVAHVLADYATRLWTHGQGNLQKANVIEALELGREANGFAGQTFLLEMLDWKPDNVMAAADKFDKLPEFQAALRATAYSDDPDKLSLLIQEMKNHAAANAPLIGSITYDAGGKSAMLMTNERREMIEGMSQNLEKLRPLLEGLDALSPSERAFMSSVLTKDIANPLDLRALEAWRDGAKSAPSFTLYRGIPDSTKAIENADGSLTLIPQKQTHLGERRGVSMSIDPEQAGVYTRGPKGASTVDVQTGTILEIDGEWALAENGMTHDDLMGNARNFQEGGADEAYNLGMWGHPDEAATEVTWLSDEPVTIPANKWRAQTREQTAELRFKASESKHGTALRQEMSPTIGGWEAEDLIQNLRQPVENVIIDMPAELQGQLVQVLSDNAEEWKRYYAAEFTDNPLPRPEPLFDYMPSQYPLDLLDEDADTFAALNKYLDDWMDAGDTPIREQLRALEERVGGFEDYLREQLGLPTVTSLNPVKSKETFRADARSPFRQVLETDFSLRGKGGFGGDIDGWSPMFDDFEEWERALENELAQTLARPENADAVRQSDWMLQGPDGQPVARPPEEGVARLYQPVVPRDIGHLDGLLTSTRFQPTLEQEIQESLSTLARTLDNPRLPKAQATLWGEIQYLSTSAIDGMEIGTHPINIQARKVAKLIRGERSNAEVQRAIQAGEQLTSNPAIYEQAERTLTASTRQKTWDDVATELINTPRAVAYTDDTVHAMSQDDRIAIVSRALRQIESNKAYYSQPMTTTLEQMAFDSPSIARWLTSVLSDTPLDDLASSRVGQIDVARAAIQSSGEWNSGVRLASTNNQTGVGRFWQLDDTHRGASIPVDAQTVHWFGRGESKVLGTDRMAEHGSFVVGDGYDKALQNWAAHIRENWVNSQRRGVEEAVKVKSKGVARRGLDGYEELPVGSRLELAEDYYEIGEDGVIGNPVGFGDTRFFESEVAAKQDDLMWNILGPAVRDHYELAGGHTTKLVRRNPKKGSKIKVGEKVLPRDAGGEDIITMTRSRVEDVQLEGDSVPNLTVIKNYDKLNDTKWDKGVRYGFNKIIGPVMDALSRKPMSFHYFVNAYEQNMKALPWMLDTQLFRNAIPDQFGDLLHLFAGETNLTDAERLATKAVAARLGDDLGDVLDPADLKKYLLSLGRGGDEIKQALVDIQMSARGAAVQRQIDAGADATRGLSIAGTPEAELSAHIDTLLDSTNFDMLRYGIDSPGLGASNSERFVEFYHDLVPDEVWDEGAVAVKAFLDDEPGVFADFTADQWRVLHAARGNLKHTLDLAEDTASIRAMNNVIPFLDSHEQRSMMAEYGRNFIPFWYAQENFIKRWARTMSTSPVWGADQLRKLQLMYMGLKSSGVVRTDPNGKDWVVYPGSGLLVEAVGKIPGMDHKPIGVLFQASTDSMLPGIESDMGSSSVSPFVGMPVHLVNHFFPETKGLKRALLGDIGASRSVMSQFVPGVAQNLWSAAFENEDSNTRYGSAMITAMAMSEAEGRGLKEGATAYEVEEYLDEMRNHARVILFAQAITGYITPGAPSSIATGEDVGSFGWLTGLGVESPGMLASDLYRQYISNLGPEEGTTAFINAFPKLDLEDVVNPMAFTVPGSETISKAPLPATEKGMAWYNSNKGWIDSQPEAGAWFLPTDDDSADFDYYSYSQQFVNGLRKRKSPQEFITSMKYRVAADVYFAEKDRYEEAQLAIGEDNKEGLDKARVQWDNWKTEFMTAHPIFAEEVQSGDSRIRRARTIDQLRYAVTDPAAPDSPHMEGIALMVREYDRYQAQMKTYKYDRTAKGQEEKRRIKLLFEDWANRWKRDNPQLDRLWSSVYKPEADL